MGLLKELLGPTDHSAPGVKNNPRQRTDLGHRLFGPTDGHLSASPPPGRPIHTDQAPPPPRGGLIASLLGPTDTSGDAIHHHQGIGNPASRETKKKKGPNLVVHFIAATGTAAVEAYTDFTKKKKKNLPPPSAGSEHRIPPVQTETGIIPRRVWIQEQFLELELIRQMPRSSWFNHPDVQAERERIARLPRHEQPSAATRVTAGYHALDNQIHALHEQSRLQEALRKYLSAHPLTTGEWNGYKIWHEQLMTNLERSSAPFDPSQRLRTFVWQHTKAAANRFIRRTIDDVITKEAPKVTRDNAGRLILELPDSHLDDQIIFNGSTLILYNPTGAQDVTSFSVSQMDSSVEISFEGPPVLQALTALKSVATGKAEPITIFKRGLVIVRPIGRKGEYVRVPMIDAGGFVRALRELASECRAPQKGSGTPVAHPVRPGTIRDLIEFPEDDELNRTRMWSPQPPPVNTPSQSSPAEDHDGSLNPDELSRKVRALLRQLTAPTQPDQNTQPPDDGDVVDGEFRVL